MNKHQLRQSAVVDFMQSLEQLNELWENEIEGSLLEEEPKAAEAEETQCQSSCQSARTLKAPHSEKNSQQA